MMAIVQVGVDFEDEKTLEAAAAGKDKVGIPVELVVVLFLQLSGMFTTDWLQIVFITPFVAAHQTLTELWIEAFQKNSATIKHIIRFVAFGHRGLCRSTQHVASLVAADCPSKVLITRCQHCKSGMLWEKSC